MANDDEVISFAELFTLLRRRITIIASVTVISLLVGSWTVWRQTPLYEAYSTLLFPAGGTSALAGVAQSLGFSVPSISSGVSIQMYRAILESDRIRQIIARQIQIPPKDLKQMTLIKEDPQANSITIWVRHKNPQLAQRVAKLYISALRDLNRQLNLPLVRNQLEFLERELALRTKQLHEAESNLLKFQKRLVAERGAPSASVGGAAMSPSPVRGLTSIGGGDSTYLQQLNNAQIQLKQVEQQIMAARAAAQQVARSATNLPSDLPPAAQLRTKLKELEYELRVAELTYGPDAPNVVKLKREIQLARQQLQKEIENYLRAVNMNLDPNLASLEMQKVGLEAQIGALQQLAARAPEDTIHLQRLAREVSTLSEIIQQLRIAREQTRMEMARDPNRWEVLEDGTIKEGPVNKRWHSTIALAFVSGLFFGIVVAWVVDKSFRSS